MGAAGIAGHTYPSDNIALSYVVASFHLLFFHVKVLCGVSAVVANLYISAIATLSGRFGYGTIGGGHNWGANRCRIIRSFMWSYAVAIIPNPSF